MSINSKLEFFRRAVDYWKIYGFKEFLALSLTYLRGRLLNLEAPLDAHADLLASERVDALATPSMELFSSPYVAIIGELSLSQCKKYRIVQKMEIFDHMGIEHDHSSWQDGARAMAILQYATVAIFYRVPCSEQLDVYLKECKRLGVKTIYDIDDPVFSRSTYSRNMNLQYLHPAEKSALLDGCEKFLSAMQQCDHLVGSTPYICELMTREAGQQAFLWRNLLDSETVQATRRVLSGPKPSSEVVRIGYASGSRAHEADFRTITDVVAAILDEYASVELHILGHLDVPEELKRFEGRVICQPFTGFEGYMGSLAAIDINLVPLLRDEFNDSKSAIRYMEAGALGIPTVAAHIGDFVNLIEEGATGYLARDAQQWHDCLEALLKDESLRKTIGENARNQVLQEFATMGERYIGHIDDGLLEVIHGR